MFSRLLHAALKFGSLDSSLLGARELILQLVSGVIALIWLRHDVVICFNNSRRMQMQINVEIQERSLDSCPNSLCSAVNVACVAALLIFEGWHLRSRFQWLSSPQWLSSNQNSALNTHRVTICTMKRIFCRYFVTRLVVAPSRFERRSS
jgi:hypothetical protein